MRLWSSCDLLRQKAKSCPALPALFLDIYFFQNSLLPGLETETQEEREEYSVFLDCILHDFIDLLFMCVRREFTFYSVSHVILMWFSCLHLNVALTTAAITVLKFWNKLLCKCKRDCFICLDCRRWARLHWLSVSFSLHSSLQETYFSFFLLLRSLQSLWLVFFSTLQTHKCHHWIKETQE